ncbi:thiolase [Methylobacterium tarhaniae]|uniref:Thiolase n=1 Tax=Methylobacterium tarhaniae TaxID=1187852 RepID=A0A0J6SV75_9HYPH|nr:thiolase family protein [Methylobacterium tarhaniae]KMO37619.1 thiolase [Methylobacterium tarhaniae]
MSRITGIGLTPFGRLPGLSTLDLMSRAATDALADAGLERCEIDGLITGYSTTHPHLMLSTVFAEHFGLRPAYAHAIQLGGATGFALVMLAHLMVEAGAARRILVVAGENRLSGQSRDAAIQTLAQVGHPTYEVPLGPTIPAYYGLVASRYAHAHGIDDHAELAVLMRANAARTPGAHLSEPITAAMVRESKSIAAPLRLLDCCPVSDGGAAFVIERDDPARRGPGIRGAAQAHTHQHVSAAASLTAFGAGDAAARALAQGGIALADIRYAAIYDSFTITLAILLEEIGLAPRGAAGRLAREGHFSPGGAMPLNTHGGLLSYGHCGVGGAMAHLAETVRQMRGEAGPRQVEAPALALLHGDGGVLSSHVSLVLENGR